MVEGWRAAVVDDFDALLLSFCELSDSGLPVRSKGSGNHVAKSPHDNIQAEHSWTLAWRGRSASLKFIGKRNDHQLPAYTEIVILWRIRNYGRPDANPHKHGFQHS